MTKPIGRVPTWCSRDARANRFTFGVMFHPMEPEMALRFSCCANDWTPGTPVTSVPLVALVRAFAIVLTLTEPHDVNAAFGLQRVWNRRSCNVGSTFQMPLPPPKNIERVV